ncbi:MAG: HAD family hydrolase [Christensenellales bacterium]
MIKDVLFDLDGTLIDSSECIYSVYSALFKEMGIRMPVGKERRKLIGPPVERTLKNFTNLDPTHYGKRFREIYSTVDLKKTNRLYDGIEETLRSLSDEGYRLFTATSKAEKFAVKILDYLGADGFFTAIYGSRYELNRTEKKDVIEDLVADFGLKKEDCILIGDTVFDVEGAKNAGIKVAIVKYGFGEEEDFCANDVEFFADSPMDIVKKLEEING